MKKTICLLVRARVALYNEKLKNQNTWKRETRVIVLKKNHNGTHIIMLSPIKHPVLQIENKTVKNE